MWLSLWLPDKFSTLPGAFFSYVVSLDILMTTIQVKAIVNARMRAVRKDKEHNRDQQQHVFADVVA